MGHQRCEFATLVLCRYIVFKAVTDIYIYTAARHLSQTYKTYFNVIAFIGVLQNAYALK